MKKIMIYGLLSSIEYQSAKCCALVIFWFLKILEFKIFYRTFLKKIHKNFVCRLYMVCLNLNGPNG